VRLFSKPQKVTEIHRKTRAKMFSDVEVGDVLQFSMRLGNMTGASGGGSYATVIHIENLTQGIATSKGQSELANLLNGLFELREETY
jgi:hypothetical protein